jgi:hypothetical protein
MQPPTRRLPADGQDFARLTLVYPKALTRAPYEPVHLTPMPSQQHHHTHDGQAYPSFAVGLVDEQPHGDSARGQSSAPPLPLPARNGISYVASLPASQDVWLVLHFIGRACRLDRSF